MIGAVLATVILATVFGTLGYFIGHDEGRKSGKIDGKLDRYLPTTAFLLISDDQITVTSEHREETAIDNARYNAKHNIDGKWYVYKKIATVKADVPVSVEKVK